ncbi:hypothetical protein CDN99_25670 [Roseateles aquatilis]|uniref:Uncharacterized protein n=1 Tax=Roseateles aquatilis TaxID=431061 RepID=A0A246ITG6_9BURK|nr:hypothetical protein [Roseateles aquatilis]OWQ83528.1 hypothetical protein CDN99_25670 [Roseateles aquatilis]
MFLPNQSYDEASAFVLGYDIAMDGEVLRGFQEWLSIKAGGGANLHWSVLVLEILLLIDTRTGARIELDAVQQKAAIEGLFDLIFEFDAERR